MRRLGLGLWMGLVGVAGVAQATSVTIDDESNTMARYRQMERDRFEVLRADSSPRVQVLAGSIWLDPDDVANKLLPKPDEIKQRAVGLAPDDAFVQWFAAEDGSYFSSQCGPTRWPEAEVANLTRLEADNAAAWQYAVALAHAKGDHAGIDAALARMAGARRASDHQGELLRLWQGLYAQHPAWLKSISADIEPAEDGKKTLPSQDATMLRVLQDSANQSGRVDAKLEAVCKPDATQDSALQRLGWCVRAGELLADKGSSISLRQTGLKMLAAAGATQAELADQRYQLQYLIENAATPQHNYALFGSADDGLAADWRNADGDIAATLHRLARLGLPATPPPGWVSAAERMRTESDHEEDAWLSYLGEVSTDLAARSDVRERALGWFVKNSMRDWTSTDDAAAEGSAAATNDAVGDTDLADLAAANPGNAFVQWLALGDASANAQALVRLQQLDADNAFVWLASLKDEADAGQILHRAAEARRYDDYHLAMVGMLYAAFQRQPVPQSMREMFTREQPSDGATDVDKQAAMGGAIMLSMMSPAFSGLSGMSRSCAKRGAANAAATRGDCIAVARLLLHSGNSLLTTGTGARTLLELDALDGEDRELARHIAWWRGQAFEPEKFDGALVDDLVAKGEIAAMRGAAMRAGKAEPPAGWQPPGWSSKAKIE
ncbi:MAG: hypothetical protein IT467_07570 [Dokdonella sp.]|nr:hypothetical protein [Dokdonella sp.]